MASSAAESSEMENAPLTVPEATPGTIAAGDDTISVKQASVPGTSPNKETTHLKIRGSQHWHSVAFCGTVAFNVHFDILICLYFFSLELSTE